jgi:LEA14-like dessication related protein
MFKRKKTIVITPTSDGMAASILGNKRCHTAGKSFAETVGRLVIENPHEFSVDIQKVELNIKPKRYITISEEEYECLVKLAGWSRK